MTPRDLITIKVQALLHPPKEQDLLDFIDQLMTNKAATLAALKAEVKADYQKRVASLDAYKTTLQTQIANL